MNGGSQKSCGMLSLTCSSIGIVSYIPIAEADNSPSYSFNTSTNVITIENGSGGAALGFIDFCSNYNVITPA